MMYRITLPFWHSCVERRWKAPSRDIRISGRGRGRAGIACLYCQMGEGGMQGKGTGSCGESVGIFCPLWKMERDAFLYVYEWTAKLSSLLLLDLLARSSVRIYYAGDFDPEGLLIAQKLKQYYQGEMIFWHMTSQDYDQAMSKETISDRRLKMLERITDPGLLPAVERMREEKKAGYQEKLIGLYTD